MPEIAAPFKLLDVDGLFFHEGNEILEKRKIIGQMFHFEFLKAAMDQTLLLTN